MFYTGKGACVQIGKEESFGVKVTPTTLVNFTSESVGATVSKGDEGSLLASKTATDRDVMAVDVSGSISFILRPETAKMLLSAALGGVVTESSADGKKTSRIVLADAGVALPSLSIYIDRKVKTECYPGCTVKSLNLDFNAGEYVTGSFEVVGTKEEDGSITTLPALTIPSYKCSGATFKIGGTTIDITSASLSLNNNVEEAPRTYSSGLYKGQPQAGQRTVTLTFNLLHSTSSESIKTEYLFAEKTASVELECTSSASGYTIKIEIPNLTVTKLSANVSGSGAITASGEGEALSKGAVEPLSVTVSEPVA